MLKNRQEAIARLCALQREITDAVLGYDEPNDCFCADASRGGNPDPPGYWQSSGKAIEFIEEAVHEKIARYKESHATP
jgi:hypothetical protein